MDKHEPLEGKTDIIMPEVEAALRPHILALKRMLPHQFKDDHNIHGCKRPVCEFIQRKRQVLSERDSLFGRYGFIYGQGYFKFRYGLQKEHVESVSKWYLENLAPAKQRKAGTFKFLESVAHAHALMLVLLHLKQKEWETAAANGTSKRKKLSEDEMMRHSFNYLIGEGFPDILESESSQEEDDDKPIPRKDRKDDVASPPIIRLEWLMFRRTMEVRDACEPLSWGKDAAPHQEGVDIEELGRHLRTYGDDFCAIDDDEWLNDLFVVRVIHYLQCN
jgi:hypothetical protein